MKINRLEIENVKRVRALTLEPAQDGLTILGGRNGQGKTSVLDAIAWALGGEKYRPTNPTHEGSVIPPMLRVELSNGIVVERKGKTSALTVTDPKGEKAGQTLLDAFIEKLALDLPRFMNQSNKEKADTLLKIIGVEDELNELKSREQQLYNHRRVIGQIADQKEKFAREMPHYRDVPDEPIQVSEIIRRQQEILARNSENGTKRQQLALCQDTVDRLTAELEEAIRKRDATAEAARDLNDEDPSALEDSILTSEETNRRVRANLDKQRASQEAQKHRVEYDSLSEEIETVRQAIAGLLSSADLPLAELGVNEAGELTYKGFTWGDMSGAEQLRVATAIIQKLNPACEFVLIDKLEQMDLDTLSEFGSWLEAQGLQAICTRVSTGAECTLVIDDGMAQASDQLKTWKEGQF